MMQHKPSPRVLWSWVTLTLLTAVPLIVGTILLLYVQRRIAAIFAGIWSGLMLVILCVYLPLRRRHMSFALDEQRIGSTGGVLFVTSRRIPLDAVRQVTLLQGPVERLCGTAFLLVTATGGHLLIEGIDYDRAEDWCRRLSHR